MKVFIKNMVCPGSKKFVLRELKALDFKHRSIELGEVEFEADLSLTELEKLDYSLHKYDLAVIFGKNRLTESIRNAVLNLVNNNIILKTSFSFYISNTVGHKYTYLNNSFLEETGTPIYEFYIEKKFEKMTLKKHSRTRVFSPADF